MPYAVRSADELWAHVKLPGSVYFGTSRVCDGIRSSEYQRARLMPFTGYLDNFSAETFNRLSDLMDCPLDILNGV
jgi:hypothetical protein